MDDDGSRSLDFSEFKKGVDEFGIDMDKKEIQAVFDEIDKDGSGTLDFDEFLKAIRVRLFIYI